MGKTVFAVLSGMCAAAASFFGKLSGLPVLEDLLILRILFFGLMIICNGGVWTLFVKALQHTESSLTATVTSAASNYLCSAVVGYLFLGEVTSLLWWSGLMLIMFGLVLILQDERSAYIAKER